MSKGAVGITQSIILVICAVLLVWWVAGNQWNRLRMRQVLAALRPVMRRVGAQPTLRWHGAAACEVQLGELTSGGGLTGGAFLVRLLPRDIPLAWAYRAWRGRRDRLDVVWQVALASSLKQLPRPEVPALLEWHPDEGQLTLRAAFDVRPQYETAVSECLVSMAASFGQAGQDVVQVVGAGGVAAEGGTDG